MACGELNVAAAVATASHLPYQAAGISVASLNRAKRRRTASKRDNGGGGRRYSPRLAVRVYVCCACRGGEQASGRRGAATCSAYRVLKAHAWLGRQKAKRRRHGGRKAAAFCRRGSICVSMAVYHAAAALVAAMGRASNVGYSSR